MNSVVMIVVYSIAQHVINGSNACGYPSCLLSLYVNTFHGMFECGMLNFDTSVLSTEDKSIE